MQHQFQILGHSVSFRTSSPSLAEWLRRLMRSFPAGDPNVNLSHLRFSVEKRFGLETVPRRAYSYEVYCNETYCGEGSELWSVLRVMEWQLHTYLGRNVNSHLLLHAAAVAYDDQATLLIGESGSGKSTSALALFLGGCRYLSDELAVVEMESADVATFAKPFSLKTLTLFPQLAQYSARILGPETGGQAHPMAPVWYIHPLDIRSDSVETGHISIRNLIFPQVSPVSEPTIESMTQDETMTRLIENCANPAVLHGGGLACVAHLAREKPAYRLVLSNAGDLPTLINWVA